MNLYSNQKKNKLDNHHSAYILMYKFIFLYKVEIYREATLTLFIIVGLSFFQLKEANDFYFARPPLRKAYSFILLFIITILTQNYDLNYEIITWDVPSYLVTSQQVMNGEIPFSSQWESKGPLFFYLYSLFNILS